MIDLHQGRRGQFMTCIYKISPWPQVPSGTKLGPGEGHTPIVLLCGWQLSQLEKEQGTLDVLHALARVWRALPIAQTMTKPQEPFKIKKMAPTEILVG
jgi:hypothetical protein